MINLENGKMTVDGENWSPIDRWEVWFMTPFGIVNSPTQAAKACGSNNMDPNMTIIPVTVAISKNNDVEVVRR